MFIASLDQYIYNDAVFWALSADVQEDRPDHFD